MAMVVMIMMMLAGDKGDTVSVLCIVCMYVLYIVLIRIFINNDDRKHPDEMETEQVGPSAKSFTPFVGVGEDFLFQNSLKTIFIKNPPFCP